MYIIIFCTHCSFRTSPYKTFQFIPMEIMTICIYICFFRKRNQFIHDLTSECSWLNMNTHECWYSFKPKISRLIVHCHFINFFHLFIQSFIYSFVQLFIYPQLFIPFVYSTFLPSNNL